MLGKDGIQVQIKPVLDCECQPINMKYKSISLEVRFKKSLTAFVNFQAANLRGSLSDEGRHSSNSRD